MSQCAGKAIAGIPALAVAAGLAVLAACGAQNSTISGISVAFTSGYTPPTAMTESEPCAVAATVTGDNKFQGVQWTATCGSANCGSFTSTISASAVPITYTSPAAVPTGDTVIVTATSVTDPTQKASSPPITIGGTSSGCTSPGPTGLHDSN